MARSMLSHRVSLQLSPKTTVPKVAAAWACMPGSEVFLSLPRRSCWESTVSLGLVGVVESGPAVVVEPVLAGLLQAVLAGLSDGFSASVVFVVGGDVADGLVESDVVVVAADSVQLGFEAYLTLRDGSGWDSGRIRWSLAGCGW